MPDRPQTSEAAILTKERPNAVRPHIHAAAQALAACGDMAGGPTGGGDAMGCGDPMGCGDFMGPGAISCGDCGDPVGCGDVID